MENGENQNKDTGKKKIIKIGIYVLVSLIIVGLAFSSFYFYRQYKKASVVKTEDTRDELAILTDEIKNFMELPDEIPTLATVTDIEKAKNQPFFANALNGDKVLIYVNAKKAILYRPALKKIIEVANVSGLSENQNSVSDATAQNQPEAVDSAENSQADQETLKTAEPEIVRVAIYNGSDTKGLAATLAGKVDDIENVKITEKTNAKGNYDTTFVADLSGKNTTMCEKIAQAIGGQVGVFPENEKMPEADILVIGGNE